MDQLTAVRVPLDILEQTAKSSHAALLHVKMEVHVIMLVIHISACVPPVTPVLIVKSIHAVRHPAKMMEFVLVQDPHTFAIALPDTLVQTVKRILVQVSHVSTQVHVQSPEVLLSVLAQQVFYNQFVERPFVMGNVLRMVSVLLCPPPTMPVHVMLVTSEMIVNLDHVIPLPVSMVVLRFLMVQAVLVHVHQVILEPAAR